MSEEKKVEAQEEIDVKKEKETLWAFIEIYQKTFAVIGVFIVLGLFWKNSSPDGTTPYVSYICFFTTIPLFLEVWHGYNLTNASWNLQCFFYLFSSVMWMSMINLIFTFPNHTATLMAGGVWLVFIYILLHATDVITNWLNNKTYKMSVESVVELDKKGLDNEIRNELVKNLNEKAKAVYESRRNLQKIAVIFIFIFSFFVWNYADTVLHALFDSRVFDIEKLEIPPVEN